MKVITSDLTLVGGGIVGVSTALQLKQRYPSLTVTLLEKEPVCARHQTGHNSGVVHAGVYYAPGSLKARFCKQGATQTAAFCREHHLPFHRCGKLLVATDERELERMEALERRCAANEIEVQRLGVDHLQRLEPRITGLGALRVSATAITDFSIITNTLLDLFVAAGGTVQFDAEVVAIEERAQQLRIRTDELTVESGFLVVCGGLMADRLARMMAIDLDFRIIPFRGEYYRLPGSLSAVVSHLIYPIPDPDLPFLGVHLTPMIDGSITVGPNAVLGWKREGYGRFNFAFGEVLEMIRFPGFWKVLRANLGSGTAELIDSLYRPGYLKRVRKYCPSLRLADLLPYPAGIRAQAVLADGSLVHDFLFARTPRSLHVCNAPSPAATSALPIGSHLADKAAEHFRL